MEPDNYNFTSHFIKNDQRYLFVAPTYKKHFFCLIKKPDFVKNMALSGCYSKVFNCSALLCPCHVISPQYNVSYIFNSTFNIKNTKLFQNKQTHRLLYKEGENGRRVQNFFLNLLLYTKCMYLYFILKSDQYNIHL